MIPLLIGYFCAAKFNFIMNPIVNILIKTIKGKITTGSLQVITYSLFVHNLGAILILFVGFALFAVFGIIFLIFNGMIIGYLGTKLPIISFLLLILPHGIFEIPSVVISVLVGFIVLSFIIKSIKCIKNSDLKISESLKLAYNTNSNMLKQALALFILVIILVFIAAFIEANLIKIINLQHLLKLI